MSPVRSKVLRFHDHGEPLDVLVEEDAEIAEPGAGRIRVRVSAVGLNPADWELCRGFMAGSLPRGIGYDVAGTVEAVGEGVVDVAAGDTVFGTADFLGQPSAGAAEVALLDSWYALPAGLDPTNAATLPMVVLTARWTLDAMGVDDGDTLLINGAGGMVGYAAAQIALERGARVIAAAGPTFAAELTAMGCEVTAYGDGIAERARDIAGGPVDRVLDTSRPTAGTIQALLGTTEDPARVMTVSNHDEARQLGARVNLDHLSEMTPPAEFLPQYAARAAAGQFRIPVARTYRLEDWRAAVELSMSGHPHGKLVLLP